ncbi:MAG: hypothetical protein ABR564_09415 [Candidatus Dormibacteria bacterium]
MSRDVLHVPMGTIALRLTPFRRAHDELAAVGSPPWPRWLTALYQLQSAGSETGSGGLDVTLSAALSAVRDRVGHRLTLLAWIVGELEQLGWRVVVVDDDVIATKAISPQHARETLEAAGVAGAMTAVSELDTEGWPRLYESWELQR